jgi:ribose transport system permease protein
LSTQTSNDNLVDQDPAMPDELMAVDRLDSEPPDYEQGPTPQSALAAARSAAPNLLYRYALVLVLLLMVVLYSVTAPDTFFTFSNLRVITSTQAVLIVAVLGLILPFATGEFDLSFGPIIAWASTLLAVLTVNEGWALAPAIAVVLVSCAAWGALNSFFIVRIGISSLITTLGSGTIIVGATLAVSHSNVIAGPPKVLTDATTTDLFGLPLPVYFGLGLAVLVWLLLDHTPVGRYIYFVGEGRTVARLSGLPVDRIRLGALMVSAVLCGVAGLINFGRLGSADPNLGMTFLLPGTAAVFLGATAIRPGRFNAWGTVVAVYVLVVGVTGLQLLGGAGWLENVFNGTALILAVTFAHLLNRDTREE